MKQNDLKNLLFTFNKRLAIKSLNNDLKDFINKQDNQKLNDFQVFKIMQVKLESQNREQEEDP